MYLTDIPQEVEEYGFCKTLLVRREVIHIKHIMTEVFVRKSIDIIAKLDSIGWDLMRYMEYMTHRLRHIHKIDRAYTNDINNIVKESRSHFFPHHELYKGLDTLIVLDFDGVVTKKSFEPLYNLCMDRGRVEICSANPTIKEEYFVNRGLPLPRAIHSCKGKVKKLNHLISISQKKDFTFFVDNEDKYLEVAWLFGIKTFKYENNKIVNFSLKTK
jgi:hypothetical protein